MLWLVDTVGKPMYSCNGKLWLPYMTALCLTMHKDKELPLTFCVFWFTWWLRHRIIILINDCKENFLRVDLKNGNSGPPQLEPRNQRKKPKTQKQTYAKGHNKQFFFHQTGITLITPMSFHLVNINSETLLLKPVKSPWMRWNYTSSFMCFQCFQFSLLFSENEEIWNK